MSFLSCYSESPSDTSGDEDFSFPVVPLQPQISPTMMESRGAGPALTNSDYTVGWICALPKELVAATAMLDERHPDLPKPASDINTYTLGSIEGHNAVLCCLPKGMIGNVPAATIASHLVTTFPSIKLGLLVGIGGGVPSNKIRLGDVVVSTASGAFPGVVKWDSGKAHESGKFERTGSLNSPPQALLTALSKLTTQHDLAGSAIPRYLEKVKEEWPRLAAKSMRTDSLKDVLFKSAYSHVSEPKDEEDEDEDEDENEQESCHLCDKSMTVKRKPREMLVHYGLIASGDKLIKDAVTRNQLNKDLGGHVLCIEMEAAGIMNNFPCLVVRGICDYADSHKNKDWQEHAAFVAAAFTKELLQYVSANDVQAERPVKELVELVRSIDTTVSKTHADVSQVKSEQARIRDNSILEWLTTLEYGFEQRRNLQLRQSGTGNWFFDTEEFVSWMSLRKQTLFCEGIPGAGKTILTSIVIDHLASTFQDDSRIGIAYIYCNYQRQDEQTVDQLLASFLKQLAGQLPSLPEAVINLYNNRRKLGYRSRTQDIVSAIEALVSSYSQVFILIDALDEYGAAGSSRGHFLQQVGQFQQMFEANVFMTSRFDSSIGSQIEKTFQDVTRMAIRAAEEDINTYVEGNLDMLPATVYENRNLRRDIIDGITTCVDGMFLLAQVYMSLLSYQDSETELRLQLEAFAKRKSHGADGRIAALSVAYKETMDRINRQHSKHAALAREVLLWLTHARRALKVKELQNALAISSLQRQVSVADLPYRERLVDVCAGLVAIDERRKTIHLVHYTVQEYFSKNPDELSPLDEKDIALSCLAYLCLHPVPKYHMPWRQLEKIQRFTFYNYAAKHWGDHALRSSVPADEIIGIFNKHPYIAKSLSYVLRADFCYEDTGPVAMLYLAVYFGLASLASKLIDSGVEVDGLGHPHRWMHGSITAPLSYAVEFGRATLVELLLKAGANPNFSSMEREQWTIPRSTVFKRPRLNRTAITRLLLKGKAHTDVQRSEPPGDDHKPVPYAVRGKPEDIIRSLLEWGANDMQVEFLHAAQIGYEAVVRVFIENGLDVNYHLSYSDQYFELVARRKALSFATEKGHEAVVRYLIENGADVTLQDLRGRIPLLLAAGSGNQAILNLLLRANGGKVDCTDKYGETALCYAVRSGNEPMVSHLLEKGFDPDPKLESKDDLLGCAPPLWYAAKGGNTGMVELLLAKGADPNSRAQRTSRHETPLSVAAKQGHQRIVRLLLDKGARLDPRITIEGDVGRKPPSSVAGSDNEAIVQSRLQHGASPGHLRAVKDANNEPLPASWPGSGRVDRALFEAGASQMRTPDALERPSLCYAAEKGHRNDVQLLLQNGADVDSECTGFYRGIRTPLSFAAENGHESIVQILLDNGANTSSQCRDIFGPDKGKTPLSFAARSGHTRIVQMLLEQDHVDSDHRDDQLCNPLYLAVAAGHHEVVQVLIAKGVNLNSRSSSSDDGIAPLSAAISKGHFGIARLLIDNGADVDPKNDKGQTPLLDAAKHGYSEDVLRLLIENGADVNSQDRQGMTPLAFVATNENSTDIREENARFLIQHGANIDLKDRKGRTPLSHAAERYDSQEFLRLLIENGADVNSKDSKGKTPLAYAAIHACQQNALLLVRSGADIRSEDAEGETPISLAKEYPWLVRLISNERQDRSRVQTGRSRRLRT